MLYESRIIFLLASTTKQLPSADILTILAAQGNTKTMNNNKSNESILLAQNESGEQMIEFALLFLTVPDLRNVATINRHFSKHVPNRQDVWKVILEWFERANPLMSVDNPPSCEDMRSARQGPSFWPAMRGSMLPPSFRPTSIPPYIRPTSIPRQEQSFWPRMVDWLIPQSFRSISRVTLGHPQAFPLRNDPRLSPSFSHESNFEKLMAIQAYAKAFEDMCDSNSMMTIQNSNTSPGELDEDGVGMVLSCVTHSQQGRVEDPSVTIYSGTSRKSRRKWALSAKLY
ncbi:unnamed protein product [Cylindrotheca closterium]|uniref:F-box domain-containing protein n=1 Tax=Cylindrotheca closterium TaxID=2856 RepID=A0AAD2CIY2_9STRA|nr:unnamed protein product [Cylindrotheca closterium]